MLTMTNSTADFEAQVEVEETDPYGDTTTNTTWQTVAEGVACRFEARGTKFVTEGGERVSRPSKLYAPLRIDDTAVHEGARVTVTYRGDVRTYRIISYDPRMLVADGYLDLDLEDWSDS